jgi:[acyl-carrier-protein] S-malonyltransferase
MVNKTAFLFPGQGAQYPGMGKDLHEASPAVRELFSLASETAGKDMSKILFEGSADDLKSTDNTQIGITLVSLSVLSVLRERGITSSVCAGFSLGEFAAYTDAGIIDPGDIFRVVLERGRIMQKACSELSSTVGECGMAAVLGLPPETVADTLSRSGIKNVYAANWNSPVQVVISGTKEAITAAEPVLKQAGAKRIIALQVAGPFHSPLMQKAADDFGGFLSGIDFHDPVKPCYSNVTGNVVTSGAEVKRNALLHITNPVLWTTIEKNLSAEAPQLCLETGPGKVLSGLWDKGETASIPCKPAGTLEEINTIANNGL